ncbi:MAG: PKD domain-containing protein [Bacteroidetes bacterium]|jgi:PKD repeat protein|nr:PKD domain-containing protein [Bacteroidota bacterium]MBT6835529.1 PKD domain-containing protein [Bacteroidota bacterium]MBT7144870.1 PKD domain-containing protein [Bacteroidota bacterium]MBT7492457.1 PKD domain-containing protein [Bacteroidota bacterium]
MKTKALIFLCIFLITTNLIAQEVDFEWAVGFGGQSQITVNDGITDIAGNVYITGDFQDTVDFDPGPGIYNLGTNGYDDIFVSKYNCSGSFVWAKSIEQSDGEGASLAIDSVGNIYIIGSFSGTNIDFDPGPGVYYLSSIWLNDIFALKLDSSGGFLWAKSFGGSTSDGGRSIAIDNLGDIYLSGWFNDTVDFDPGPGVYNLITGYYGYDMFITKLDSLGNFIWAKSMLGVGDFSAYCSDLAICDKNFLYIIGAFDGTVDFDPDTNNTFYLTSNGENDIFISKLDTSGNLLEVKSIGGNDNDYGKSIKIDKKGNIYFTGYYKGTVDFNPGIGIYNLTSNGETDIFISKLNLAGNFIWTKSIGASNSDYGSSIAFDPNGNVYTTGCFEGIVDFDPGIGVLNLTSIGSIGICISKLDSLGNFVWAKSMGGSNTDCGDYISLDSNQSIYTFGRFNGTVDFDPGSAIYNLTAGSYPDVFVSKLSQPFTIIDSVTHVSCFGYFNASIDIYVYNGIPPYSFSWSNGATTEDISNIVAGTYFLTVNDAANNSIIDTFVITQPDALNITNSITSGATGGSISLTVLGGTPPYSYVWNFGSTGATVSNLPFGQYTVTVTDANQCSIGDAITLSPAYFPRLPLVEHFSSGSSACSNCCNLELAFQNVLAQTNGQCAVIRYPGNIFPDGYETSESIARYNYYGLISTIPSVTFNGQTPVSSANITATSISNSFNNDLTPISLNPVFDIIGNQINVMVDVFAIDSISSQNLVLQTAIVENKTFNNVSCSQIDSALFILKKMLPDENGTNISQISPGNTYTYTFSYIFPTNNTIEDFNNLSLVSFVQDSSTHQLYQSAWAEQAPELIANFSAFNPFGPVPHSVQFNDLSTGSPATWLWDFGDGNSSTSQNPVHEYQTVGFYTVSLIVTNFFDADTFELVNYVEIANSQYPTSWFFNTTGNNHVILIPNSAEILLNGIPIDSGDYVGVFYNGIGGLACAGMQIWENITTPLTVWGEDVGNDGFVNGEEFKWKIWDASTNTDYDAIATYMPMPPMTNQGFYANNGTSGITSLTTYDFQNISLPLGWSIFSTYMIPVNPDIHDVFSPIVSEIEMVKSGMGQIYWPAFSINQIGNLSLGQGYQVKTLSSTNLIVYGSICEPIITPVSINSGWNLIGYLRTSPAPIDTMLSSIVNEIVLAKNGFGLVYWPVYNINNIGNMIPGEGYQVKMNVAGVLVYPPN